MSFDKDYPNRKDHRKPFETVAERVSLQCRHGGSCGYCKSNRLIKTTKAELKAKNDMQFINEDSEETV